MSDKDLKDLVASLAESTLELKTSMVELRNSQKKTDEQLAKTDAQLAKTDEKIDKIAKLVGGISNNNGYFAEETYFQALEKNPVLGDVTFDEVHCNWQKSIKGIAAEYDIVMLNGKTVGLVEVKYRLHPDEAQKFKTQKIPAFKKLFPEYAKYKIIGAVASMSYTKESIREAKKNGLYVLGIKGQEWVYL